MKFLCRPSAKPFTDNGGWLAVQPSTRKRQTSQAIIDGGYVREILSFLSHWSLDSP